MTLNDRQSLCSHALLGNHVTQQKLQHILHFKRQQCHNSIVELLFRYCDRYLRLNRLSQFKSHLFWRWTNFPQMKRNPPENYNNWKRYGNRFANSSTFRFPDVGTSSSKNTPIKKNWTYIFSAKQLTQWEIDLIVSSTDPATTLEHITFPTSQRINHNFI